MNTEPAFKSVFGASWNALPPVLKKRYSNHHYSEDISQSKGLADIDFSWLFWLISPFCNLFKILVPYRGKNIPLTVSYISKPDCKATYFRRVFTFPEKAPYVFKASMLPTGGNEVIEFMNLGIGWRMYYHYDGNSVTLNHKGYVWRVFGRLIPIPLGLFLGEGYAEETPLSDDTFFLKMGLKHALFGKVFSVEGAFKMVESHE